MPYNTDKTKQKKIDGLDRIQQQESTEQCREKILWAALYK